MTSRGNTQLQLVPRPEPAQLHLTAQRGRVRIRSGPCIVREQLTLFAEPSELCLPLLSIETRRMWLDRGLLRTPAVSGTCRQRPRSRGIGGKQR